MAAPTGGQVTALPHAFTENGRTGPGTSASSRDDGRAARLPLVTARDGSSVRRGADPPSFCSSGCCTGHWPSPSVWFLAGPVGHLRADRWQSASYRVPAVPREPDAGRRSAARSPRSAFVFAGGRSQPDLLDERMSVGCPGGGVTTGSEPAPAGAAPGLGRGCARVTGCGYRQVPLPDRHAGSHLQGLRSPEGDVGVVEGDQLICCEPQPRAGRRRRGKQGERPDEHLGCLAGAEPAGEGQPRRRQSWPRSGRQFFPAVSRRGPDLPRSASCLFLSPRC